MTITGMQVMPAPAPKQDFPQPMRSNEFEKLINKKLENNAKPDGNNANKDVQTDDKTQKVEQDKPQDSEIVQNPKDNETEQKTKEISEAAIQMANYLMNSNIANQQAPPPQTAQIMPENQNLPVQALQQTQDVAQQAQTQQTQTTDLPLQDVDMPIGEVKTEQSESFKNLANSYFGKDTAQPDVINPTDAKGQSANAQSGNNQSADTNLQDMQNGNTTVQQAKGDEKAQNTVETFGADSQAAVEVVAKQEPQTLNPENLNIKVSDVVDTQKETFVQDFTDKVLVKMNENVKEFELQLNPIELGKVQIKLTFAGEKAFVSINCENAKTQAMLSQSSDIIKDIIKQNVGSDTIMFVQENTPKDYTQQQNRQQNQEQEQSQQSQKQQSPSDDTQTFINQLRLGLIKMA